MGPETQKHLHHNELLPQIAHAGASLGAGILGVTTEREVRTGHRLQRNGRGLAVPRGDHRLV